MDENYYLNVPVSTHFLMVIKIDVAGSNTTKSDAKQYFFFKQN
jgi:hypothetical protein